MFSVTSAISLFSLLREAWKLRSWLAMMDSTSASLAVVEDDFRKLDARQALGFPGQPRDDALQPEPPQEHLALVDPRRRLVEPHQRLIDFDEIALVDQQILDDAAFQVLHDLVLAGGHEVPWVITAAASGAVAPQTPKAPKQPMIRVSPMIACLRIERGTSAYQARSCMLPASEVRVIEPVP